MKKHLLLISIIVETLILLAVSGYAIVSQQQTINKLAGINTDWSYQYQSMQQEYIKDILVLNDKMDELQNCLDNRDEIITWYKEHPPLKVVKWINKDDKEANWDSVEELKIFLEADDTDKCRWGEGQCEDVAFQLRDRAYEIGKRLETEIIDRYEFVEYQQYLSGDVSNLGENDGHYICKAIIENSIYFVEPSNDKVWLAYDLD